MDLPSNPFLKIYEETPNSLRRLLYHLFLKNKIVLNRKNIRLYKTSMFMRSLINSSILSKNIYPYEITVDSFLRFISDQIGGCFPNNNFLESAKIQTLEKDELWYLRDVGLDLNNIPKTYKVFFANNMHSLPVRKGVSENQEIKNTKNGIIICFGNRPDYWEHGEYVDFEHFLLQWIDLLFDFSLSKEVEIDGKPSFAIRKYWFDSEGTNSQKTSNDQRCDFKRLCEIMIENKIQDKIKRKFLKEQDDIENQGIMEFLGEKPPIQQAISSGAVTVSTSPYVFEKIGAGYRVIYEGQEPKIVKQSNGMDYIAYLLKYTSPNKSVSSPELYLEINPPDGDQVSKIQSNKKKAQNLSLNNGDKDELIAEFIRDDLDFDNFIKDRLNNTVIDLPAKKDYIKTMSELFIEKSEMTIQGDLVRIEEINKEMIGVDAQLRKAEGKDGGVRTDKTLADFYSDNIRHSLTVAYKQFKIYGLEKLEIHLRKSLKREENHFSYKPEKNISWKFNS